MNQQIKELLNKKMSVAQINLEFLEESQIPGILMQPPRNIRKNV